MTTDMTIDGEFYDEKSGYTVFFEDDGRVAYGYLIDPEDKFVGDIWLYNRCRAPESPEWTDREKAPYANPAEYVNNQEKFTPATDFSEVSVEWNVNKNSKIRVRIFIRGELFGVLEDGAKPGWARMAKKDGPLAKVLTTEARLS